MKLVGLTETYEQEEDCCGRANETGQTIEFIAEDGGGGAYIVIKTERWAFDDLKEFSAVIKSMLARMGK